MVRPVFLNLSHSADLESCYRQKAAHTFHDPDSGYNFYNVREREPLLLLHLCKCVRDVYEEAILNKSVFRVLCFTYVYLVIALWFCFGAERSAPEGQHQHHQHANLRNDGSGYYGERIVCKANIYKFNKPYRRLLLLMVMVLWATL